MEFKPVKWKKTGTGYFVAKMAFGIQLTVQKSGEKWVWQMGNVSFVFKQGKSNSELVARAYAEYYFQEYVIENIGKCTE